MARRVISLQGQPVVLESEDIGAATEAITPGQMVMLGSSGVSKHNDDASNGAALFALERDEMGDDIDVAYASGDQVKVGAFHPGCAVYAFIPSGQNVTRGDYLTSNGSGALTKTGVSATVRHAQALETVDNTAGPGDVRIRALIV